MAHRRPLPYTYPLRESMDVGAGGADRGVGAAAGLDSSTSSSRRPRTRRTASRSVAPRARASGRKPGKQPGEPGTTMPLVDNPDETIFCDRRAAADCGADLTGAPVTAGGAPAGHRRAPAPAAAGHRVPDPHPRLPVLRAPPRRAAPAARAGPGPVRARGAGPRRGAAVRALPARRPRDRADGALLGCAVSTGFMAGVRARAARLLETAFLPRVRELLRAGGGAARR